MSVLALAARPRLSIFSRGQQSIVFRKPSTDPARAAKILHQIDYFRELEYDIPGLIENICYVAEFVHIAAGDVLFRQDDQPGNLYFIVQGGVDVYKRGPDAVRTPRAEDFDEPKPLCMCRKQKNPELQQYERRQTFEEFSTFCDASDLGDHKDSMGEGRTFADEALKNNDLRNATIKCTEDCEFLIVHKNKFDLRLCEKVSFFRNLPGFVEHAGSGGLEGHPANMFYKEIVSHGQVLLQEGRIERVCMFIIESGAVEFRRNAKYFLGLQPDENDRCWQRLEECGIFCSVTTFGVHSGEPCTARVASEECSLYIAVGDSINEFSKKSPKIFKSMLTSIAQNMNHVLRLSGALTGLRGLGLSGPTSFAPPPPPDEPPLAVLDV